MADRLVSVLGLGFGDCGKGMVTDALVRRLGAHTVLRFNGGAQAGHNVVLPDGRRHTFSQFGSGSFVPGVATALAAPVVLHPTALLAEAAVLERAGVGDALTRLVVDPRCRVTTPFHQAAGRLTEWLRGAGAHGSCGAGFGETVGHSLAAPEEVVRWGELARPAASLLDKLEAIGHRLRDELLNAAGGATPALTSHREWQAFSDVTIARRWMAQARDVARRIGRGDENAVFERLAREGTVVFEGAQGILLDERYGFHPHTTWSSTGRAAAEAVVAEAGHRGTSIHLGVLRSYVTRHGAGPLPTGHASLDAHLPEPDNRDDGWQGRFRRGHADAVLLRYAVAAAGPLHGLVVTHLDALERGAPLGWCQAYSAIDGTPRDDIVELDPLRADRIRDLRLPAEGDLEHARRLGALLSRVEPELDAAPPRNADALVERVAAEVGVPVLWGGHGPSHDRLRPIADNARLFADAESTSPS